MAFRHPQVSVEGQDLVLRIPLEIIPNLPRPLQPHQRTALVHALQSRMSQWMGALEQFGIHPATPSRMARAHMSRALKPRGVLSRG